MMKRNYEREELHARLFSAAIKVMGDEGLIKGGPIVAQAVYDWIEALDAKGLDRLVDVARALPNVAMTPSSFTKH